jgi:hypothetical protein
MSKIVVKLRGALEPPKPWKDAGWSASKHVYVDSVEKKDGHYFLYVDKVAEPWVVGFGNIQDVRPPNHPGHPNQIK